MIIQYLYKLWIDHDGCSLFYVFISPTWTAWRALIPQPGIKHVSPVMEVQSPSLPLDQKEISSKCSFSEISKDLVAISF